MEKERTVRSSAKPTSPVEKTYKWPVSPPADSKVTSLLGDVRSESEAKKVPRVPVHSEK